MKKSLIQGLKEKDMQAIVNTYNLNSFYFPTLFPLKFTPFLTWKALEANIGVPVAADVVSYNAKAPRKTRNVVERLSGDIKKIDIARDKTEEELNEYRQLLQYANTTAGAQALLDWIYDDVEFCFKGVNARLEWIAMKALSLGKVVLDSTNNAGVVTETAVDFLVPDAQKSGVATIWTDSANAKPFANFQAKQKAAKALGFVLKYAFMNQDTFDNMVNTDEVIKKSASFAMRATNVLDTPSLDNVNLYLRNKSLPEIRIIDTLVTTEINGVKTTGNPFEAGVVSFVPEIVCGSTFYAPLADDMVESSTALKVKREHVLIKKFSEEEPLTEITKASANAMPVWASAGRSFLMDTLNTTWTK